MTPITSDEQCQEPGCGGTYADGYCTRCGAADRAPPHSDSPTTRSSRRGGRLGAGLIELPAMPESSPESVVLTNPEVTEKKRFCARCHKPVGRGRDGRPGRSEGYCRSCGHHFSFRPTLHTGDLVQEQYEVVGCLAHGGQGWIYLAWDNYVDRRPVVLKGLIDSDDETARNAAVAERRFLATLNHSDIVQIYNFARHGNAEFIVMEYVPGTSLKKLRQRRADPFADRPTPLPVTQAIAYVLGILPAVGYLHDQGLLYCDFKPSNVIVQRDALKLIDLGGVHGLEDDASPVFGTAGYEAPEVPDKGPSVASDLFSVARALAVLILDFPGYRSTFRFTIPRPTEHPVLAEYDALYRLLTKATAFDPAQRFQSAEEMADALLGVLREVVAVEQGTAAPWISDRFTGDVHLTGESSPGRRIDPLWSALPAMKVSPDDPAVATLAALPSNDPSLLVELLAAVRPLTVGVQLRLARAQQEAGQLDAASATLDAVPNGPTEWRVDWHRALLALARGGWDDAETMLDRVYAQIPGELAPKLALAYIAEARGAPDGVVLERDALGRAVRLFDVVSRIDPGFTSAAIGLGRCRSLLGDRPGARDAYRRVPSTSRAYPEAQVRLARMLAQPDGASTPEIGDLIDLWTIVDQLHLSPEAGAGMRRDLLHAALDLLTSGRVAPTDPMTIGGLPLRENLLRKRLEETYRELARLAPSVSDRIRLVDAANTIRPLTLTCPTLPTAAPSATTPF